MQKFWRLQPHFIDQQSTKKDMKTRILFTLLICSIFASQLFAQMPNYDGSPLEYDESFTRKKVGDAKVSDLAEISGIACSRVTPGYLWAQGDDNYKIRAMSPEGKFVTTVKIDGARSRDWEDLCGGVYEGKNYIFVGIFGDNGLSMKDNYYIYYFEEPEIVIDSTITVPMSYIKFGYPDSVAHNAETLMYDNLEQMLYVVDKYDNSDAMGVVYSLPFRTDYDTLQVLKEECKLGNGANFMNPTGGDISPDGMHVLVKNEGFTLIWHRAEGESIAETLAGRPRQVKAYKREAQGEAIAWLDSTTFYTTSDVGSGGAPIFMYTKNAPDGVEDVVAGLAAPSKVLDAHSHMVTIHQGDKVYSLLGNLIE